VLQVAKKLKKMQVNVDVVNFGETSANTAKVVPLSFSRYQLYLAHVYLAD
jgi:hypothetical protein